MKGQKKAKTSGAIAKLGRYTITHLANLNCLHQNLFPHNCFMTLTDQQHKGYLQFLSSPGPHYRPSSSQPLTSTNIYHAALINFLWFQIWKLDTGILLLNRGTRTHIIDISHTYTDMYRCFGLQPSARGKRYMYCAYINSNSNAVAIGERNPASRKKIQCY